MPDFEPNATIEIGQGSNLVDFKVLPITLDREEELHDIQQRASDLQISGRARPLDLFTVEAEQLDIILEPVKVPAGDVPTTKETTPSKILIEAYKAKQFTRAQLQGTVGQIIDAARPT
ncbi:MAG TPA: hypothetical protein VG458_07610 [Solirubrobacterales bacterium]|nr:hypothetical protein [Solirubrobacterales bacterium]